MENGQIWILTTTLGLFFYILSKGIEANVKDKSSYAAIFGHLILGVSQILFVCSGVSTYFMFAGL